LQWQFEAERPLGDGFKQRGHEVRLKTKVQALSTGGCTTNSEQTDKERVMLYTIVAILLVLWLLGFSMNVGGGLIHTLLVIAAVVFLFNLISGRRASL